MVKVRYLDNTDCGRRIDKYDSREQAEAAIAKELEKIKGYFREREYHCETLGDLTRIWTSDDSLEYSSWRILPNGSMKTDKITIDDLLDKAEELGWFILKDNISWEFNRSSPIGKVFSFDIFTDDVHNADDMVREIRFCASDFDADIYAGEEWVDWVEEQDRVDSFPNFKTFEKDAIDVKLMLNKLASVMEDVLEGKLDDEESPETPNEESARIFCDALKTLASKPENLDNLRSYLSHHFDKWLSKYGSNPENISCELRDFADMEI